MIKDYPSQQRFDIDYYHLISNKNEFNDEFATYGHFNLPGSWILGARHYTQVKVYKYSQVRLKIFYFGAVHHHYHLHQPSTRIKTRQRAGTDLDD